MALLFSRCVLPSSAIAVRSGALLALSNSFSSEDYSTRSCVSFEGFTGQGGDFSFVRILTS